MAIDATFYTQLQTNLLNLNPIQRHADSHLIKRNVLYLPMIKDAQNIGIHQSDIYNIDIQPLISALQKQEKNIYQLSATSKNSYALNDTQLDLLIVPCLAADLNGNIISSYPIQQTSFSCPTIAISLDSQLIQLPLPHTTTKADILITQSTIRFCSFGHTCKFINGNNIAQTKISLAAEFVKKQKIDPHLSIIYIGNNPASENYIKKKQVVCHKIGIATSVLHLKDTTPETDILKIITKLNNDSKTHGILIQLPLPKHFRVPIILNSVAPIKDVDGLTLSNRHLLQQGQEFLSCCTPYGIVDLLEQCFISLHKKSIVLIGNGFLVGHPLSIMLKNRNCNFIVCDKNTKNIKNITRTGDIIISATGVPHLINENDIKYNAIVIDAGTAKSNNKIVGDVNIPSILKRASYVTPVPGGIGPITVAQLISNIVQAYKAQVVLPQYSSVVSNSCI